MTTTQSDPSLDEWLYLTQQPRSRYPDAQFDVEVIATDLVRDLVILKATVTATSGGELLDSGKGCGVAAGSLTQTVQLTLSAKRQALADLGIPYAPAASETSAPQQKTPISTQADLPAVSPQARPASVTSGLQLQPSTLKPGCTSATLKALYAKAYLLPAPQQEARWRTFVAQVIGRSVADEQFTEAEMERLHAAIQQQWQRRTTQPQPSTKTPSVSRKG